MLVVGADLILYRVCIFHLVSDIYIITNYDVRFVCL